MPGFKALRESIMLGFHSLLLLLHVHYGMGQAFDLRNVTLTNPPPSNEVLAALDVVQQIIKSYNERCFVYNHNVEGLNRRLHTFDGVTGGVTRSERVPFRFNITGKLTNKSRCSIFVMPLPGNPEELLDFDRPLWYVSSSKKILLYVQETGDPDQGLILTKFIPAINTTFTHLLIRKNSVFKKGMNRTEDQTELYCLGIDPPFKVTSFDQCRRATENLHGITITVSHLTVVPTAFRGPNGVMMGSDIAILNMMKEKYGFEYRLRKETYVDMPNNVTMGQIMRVGSGASDLGIGGTFQTNQRLKLVQYLVYMYIQDIAFITPIPKTIDLYYTIVLPFDGLTWGLIAASSISLVFFFQLSDFTWKKFFYADAVSKTDTLYHHSVIVFSSLIGYELPHTWLWHRMVYAKSILLAVTFFSGFFLNMDYKSTLRANLYTEMYSPAIDTAEEIYKSGMPVYIQNGTIQVSILANSPRKILQKIYNRAEEEDTLYNPSTQSNLTWLAQMVDQGEATYVGYTMATLNASYRVCPDILYKAISSFTVPKCSILPALFNTNLLRLNAAGIPLRLYAYFLGDKPSRSTDQKTSRYVIKTTDDPLDIEQLLLIFGVLVGGLIVSALTLAQEIYSARKELRDRNDVIEISTWDLQSAGEDCSNG